MSDRSHRVCPVAVAAGLDNRFRRWVQNPQKILQPYIKKGMKVLDVGCGPGFFTVDMAQLVGSSGQVIAADLQEGMLEIIKKKIQGTELEERVILHKCEENKIGLREQVDFILLFYVVHEVPDIDDLFREIETILKPDGQVLIVEPPLHVSKKAFERTIQKATNANLTLVERPKSLCNKKAVLKKNI